MINFKRIKIIGHISAIMLTFCLAYEGASSAEPIEISKDFTLFTSQQLQGYTKPLFTTIEQSFNSNIFTTARYEDHWNVALDISISGMFIPDAQKSYDAVLPAAYGNTDIVDNAGLRGGDTLRQIGGSYEEPTIYGGRSWSIFSAANNPYRERKYDENGKLVPDSSFKSLGFAEGNNISFMPGIPIVPQIIVGFPTRTQLRLRFWGVPVQDEFTSYFGIMANQQLDRFVNLFGEDTTFGLAAHLGYHMVSRSEGLSMNSFVGGLHASKSWENGLTLFTGLQFETLSGEFEAVKDAESAEPDDYANSPYLEVRNFEDIQFDIESFTSFRFLAGLSYRLDNFEFHGDAAWASQPMLTFGITWWIASWGEKREQETIEQFEDIERIERIRKREEDEKTREEDEGEQAKKK